MTYLLRALLSLWNLVLSLLFFIHMYHLFSKIKLQATWRQRQKISAHIPWSIKLWGTELLLKKLKIQFADLWVYGGMCTYHFSWMSKAILFNLTSWWDNFILLDWPSSPRKRYIFFSAWAAQVAMSRGAGPSTMHWTETTLNHFTSSEPET